MEDLTLAAAPPPDPTADLSPDARAIVREEEALLARVQAALRSRAPARGGRDEADLLERLKELRELAAKAAAHDLPTLFQEMNVVRSLIEQPKQTVQVDPRSPYFAHLRLQEKDGARDFCLGRASFVDTNQGVRVVDWRFAPIARLYYRYREGDPFEEQLPGRLAEGTIAARRVLVVHEGVLTRILAGRHALVRRRDGTWSEEGAAASLGGGAGTAARAGSLGVGASATDRSLQASVSAMLDREQYDALSVDGEKPLLVLGSAGSGKTTVALHRLATLAFQEPETYPVGRIQVVVPEPGLARLSSRLLEPLGLGAVSVKTLESWFRERVHGAFGAPPRLCEETPPLVARLKRHPALYHALRQRLLRQGSAGPTGYAGIRRELAEWMTDRGFLGSVVEGARGGLPTTCIEETVRHTMLQLAARTDRETQGFDPQALETVDGRTLGEGTPDELAGTIDVEDLPLFLFLKAWRAALGGTRLAHLVVDEAEDISLFELFVLGKLLGEDRSVTLAGDDAQQTFASFAGWGQALAALGAEGASTCRLQVTYRCPRPIAALAREVLGPLAPEEAVQAGRDGAPVGRFEFPSEAHANLFVADAVRELVEREPQASVGVIARTPEAAEGLYRVLADLPEARLVLEGDFSFLPGIDVTDVDNVKGLEFDYVIVPDASARAYPLDDESRRALHVAVTRASHQLWVVSVGAATPVLASARR